MKFKISALIQQVSFFIYHLQGTRLVTVSADASGRLYNVHSGECIAQLLGHKGEISKVAFNPSGNKIITASADNTARIL